MPQNITFIILPAFARFCNRNLAGSFLHFLWYPHFLRQHQVQQAGHHHIGGKHGSDNDRIAPLRWLNPAFAGIRTPEVRMVPNITMLAGIFSMMPLIEFLTRLWRYKTATRLF